MPRSRAIRPGRCGNLLDLSQVAGEANSERFED